MALSKMTSKKVRVRFAPSPTGFLHIGGARSALFNYLFARRHGGEFLLRIEDTDKERSRKEFEKDILEELEWLGLAWDGLYKQSARTDVYRKYFEKLLKEGKAYVSEEREGESKKVIRLKNHGEEIVFKDIIRGQVSSGTAELGDFVIAKSMEEPLYHFAAVVDDYEMKISHVIRGEEHLSNTPRQILIQRALGVQSPEYAHLPLILNPDRTKMSKRAGDTTVAEYRKKGYLPEAIVNFAAFLGWSLQMETNREFFFLHELAEKFDLKKIQRGGAVFNLEKLNWMNRHYIKEKSVEELANMLVKFLPDAWRRRSEKEKEWWKKVTEIARERLDKLCDITENAGYFFEDPDPEIAILVPKGSDASKTKEHLKKIKLLLNGVNKDNFTAKTVKDALWNYAEENGRGNVFWPFRVAITGKEYSPDPFTVSGILGKEVTLGRVEHAARKFA